MKVANDEAEISGTDRRGRGSLADQVVWAVDIIGAPSALLLALLARAGQSVRYASGRVVAAMSAAYAGEGKTDAKDAYVIAETARLRRDLPVIDAGTDLVRNLAVLTGHRADLIADRVRMINRLRDLMTSVFPSLERAFDYSSHKGALVLLTGYATPDRIRRVGETRLTALAATTAACADRRRRRPRASPPPRRKRSRCPAKTSPPASSPSWPPPSWPSTTASRASMPRSRRPSLNTRRPRSSQSMPGFGPFLGASLLVARRRLTRIPQRRAPRRRSRARARPQRLRPTHRQPAPIRALQPTAAARVLPVRADQHDARRTQPRLLPQEARPRRHPQPGRHRPGPPPHRRPLGTAAREPNVDRSTAATRLRRLDNTIEIPSGPAGCGRRDRMAADGSTTSAGRTAEDAGQGAGERGDDSGLCVTGHGVAT